MRETQVGAWWGRGVGGDARVGEVRDGAGGMGLEAR